MKGRKLKSIIHFNNLKKLKDHKKIMISLIVIITFLSFFLTINYGRYVKNVIEVFYLRTKNFYFNSDKLTINGKNYEIYPWTATDPYQIDLEINTLLNDLKGTDDDVPYELTCEVENSFKDKVDCNIKNKSDFISKETADSNGVYKENHHRDFPKIVVDTKNNVTLENGDEFKVKVSAESIAPYKEELSATFIFKVGDYGIRYLIENTPGNIYFDAIITNTLTDKKVNVSLDIDTNNISMDMSNNILIDSEDYKEKYKLKMTTDSNGNINKINFNLAPKSSMMVRFYKGKNFNNREIDEYLKFSTTDDVEVVRK